MGMASLALTAIGGVMSGVSQYQQGKAQEQAANHNAQIMRNQAKVQEQEAQENSKRARSNNERELASMRARLASQGTGVTEGAPLAVLGDTASELELQVLDSYRSAESNRSQLITQANTTQWQGKVAKRSGRMNAFGTLLKTGYGGYSGYRTGINTGAIKKGQSLWE